MTPDSDRWRAHELSQLRLFRDLSLREKMEAVQGMADVVRRFQQMRREGAFRSAEQKGTRNMHHITLTTGDTRESPRSEVGDEIMPVIRNLLTRALGGEHVPVPCVGTLCAITASAAASALLVTVWGVEPGRVRVPLITIGVASHEPDSAMLWRMLHDSATLPLVTQAEHPPAAPWCAARLEIGAVPYLETMQWVGDFERCLGWAWIEREPWL